MKFPYIKSIEEVATAFETDIVKGLTEEEAQKRIEKYGENILTFRNRKSVWKILSEQFVNPIIWVLVVAGLLSFSFGEVLEGIAIGVVIVINAAIGFFMEFQAVRSMEELKKMGRGRSKVIRGGVRRIIDSARIVPGDLLYIESGDIIGADARIVKQSSLTVKESALTGESIPVDKTHGPLKEDTPLADRKNCVFYGTVVTRGHATALVYATGHATEMGKIAEMTEAAEKEVAPLDKRLQELSKHLIWLTLIICIAMLIGGIIQGKDWMVMIETAIVLAVSAIPEGLPVIATMTLARSMLKLAKKNVIVKQLESVQTLGETTMILTDKTGTLTENEMYLEFIRTEDETLFMKEGHFHKGMDELYSPSVRYLMTVGVLSNNGTFDSSTGQGTGDAVEVALLRSGMEYFDSIDSVKKELPRIGEIPFDSETKMMGTLHRNKSGYIICVKGAIENVLDRCNRLLLEEGMKTIMTDEIREKWHKVVNDLSSDGLRVLSFAYGEEVECPAENDFIHNLIFIGVAGFIDPARKDVKESIESCKNAGIRVVMVTGDHPETAGNIAEKVGIVENGLVAAKVTGKELSGSDWEELTKKEKLKNTSIFARIDPSQKLDLVNFFQKDREIVGMTGDGVNDTPALKKADIGIAMGQRGTEAAKDAADMVLKDDSFQSITLAIEQGRIIYENIRNFIVYLLSCNLSEILVVTVAVFSGIPLPLTPLQILFLNMITDVFPAFALGMNKGEANIMTKPPRDPKEALIPGILWNSIIIYGILMTGAVIGIEIMAVRIWEMDYVQVNNVTFYTLILIQLFNVFNIPEASVSFWSNQVTQNIHIWLSIVFCISLVVFAWMIEPVRHALNMVILNKEYWIWIIGFSFLPILIIQMGKRWLKIFR